jgi:hypothetical protein
MPYPTEIEDLLKEVYPSQMTLLDHFAGLALSGLCANPAHVNLLNDGNNEQHDIALSAYHIAIEMLTSRYYGHGELQSQSKNLIDEFRRFEA